MRTGRISVLAVLATAAAVSPAAPAEAQASRPRNSGCTGIVYVTADTAGPAAAGAGARPAAPAAYPVVLTIAPGSPAERAALVAGDVIIAVDGQDTRTRGALLEGRPGTEYRVRVRRGDTMHEKTLVSGRSMMALRKQGKAEPVCFPMEG